MVGLVMTKTPLALYQQEIHLTLMTYRGREVSELALKAGISRASVYHLRAHAQANARADTLEKLEHALGLRTTRRGGQ